MRTVLIVDDEIAVCNLVKHLVDWEWLSFRLAGFAHDGWLALKKMEEERPDIVITDIRMPGLSGLELIREIRRRGLPVLFVIISGYREFEFARQAILYGVEDYLLKPLREQEINALLYRLSKKLQDAETDGSQKDGDARQVEALKQNVRRLWMERAFQGEMEEKTSWQEINRQFCFRFVEGEFTVWMMRVDPEKGISGREEERGFLLRQAMENWEEWMAGFYSEQVMMIGGRRGYLLTNRGLEKRRESWQAEKEGLLWQKSWREKKEHYTFTLSCSDAFFHPWELSGAVKDAENKLSQCYWKGFGRLYAARLPDSHGPDRELTPQEKEDLETAMIPLDPDQLYQHVEKLLREERRREPENYRGSLSLLFQCGEFLGDRMNRMAGTKTDNQRPYRGQAENCRTWGELLDSLNQYCRMITKEGLQSRKIQAALPVRTIQQYMKTHFAESLTLEGMAEIVHLNPVYLSGLFKKELGVNFSDYLAGLRVEKAKALLKEVDWNISEVAAQVGYGDARYFSKVFSKLVGINPKEYRRLHS